MKYCGERTAKHVCLHEELGWSALVHALRFSTLGRAVDNDRDDLFRWYIGSKAFAMLHSILNHRDGSTLFAEMFDPYTGAMSVVCLGGNYDPIHWLRL
jgi:hypothetical protein